VLVVTVEHMTSEGSWVVYADYTDQADNLISQGSVPQFASTTLDKLSWRRPTQINMQASGQPRDDCSIGVTRPHICCCMA
jgi:hypothetical protein